MDNWLILELGKPWTVLDLESYMEKQQRNWDDLHSMWWACVKERNRLATEKLERARVEAGYGDHENQVRDETVGTFFLKLHRTVCIELWP